MLEKFYSHACKIQAHELQHEWQHCSINAFTSKVFEVFSSLYIQASLVLLRSKEFQKLLIFSLCIKQCSLHLNDTFWGILAHCCLSLKEKILNHQLTFEKSVQGEFE